MDYRPFILSVVFATFVTAAGGCARPGHVMVDYTRGQEPPPVAAAPVDGVYALYPANGTEPARELKLRKGDPIGFRVRQDGVPVAVARDEQLPIEGRLAQSYYWKLQGHGRSGHWDPSPMGREAEPDVEAAVIASGTIPPDAPDSSPERVGVVEGTEPAVSTGEGADGGM